MVTRSQREEGLAKKKPVAEAGLCLSVVAITLSNKATVFFWLKVFTRIILPTGKQKHL